MGTSAGKKRLVEHSSGKGGWKRENHLSAGLRPQSCLKTSSGGPPKSPLLRKAEGRSRSRTHRVLVRNSPNRHLARGESKTGKGFIIPRENKGGRKSFEVCERIGLQIRPSMVKQRDDDGGKTFFRRKGDLAER